MLLCYLIILLCFARNKTTLNTPTWPCWSCQMRFVFAHLCNSCNFLCNLFNLTELASKNFCNSCDKLKLNLQFKIQHKPVKRCSSWAAAVVSKNTRDSSIVRYSPLSRTASGKTLKIDILWIVGEDRWLSSYLLAFLYQQTLASSWAMTPTRWRFSSLSPQRSAISGLYEYSTIRIWASRSNASVGDTSAMS